MFCVGFLCDVRWQPAPEDTVADGRAQPCDVVSGEGLTTLVVVFPMLLLSVVLHEWAHARAAAFQGDLTPARAGRLTLSPLPHLSLWGSLVVPLVLWLSPGSFLFGWAKPVPTNPSNFRDGRRGDLLVSLAGVTANVALVAACVLAWALLSRLPASGGGALPAVEGLQLMARFGIFFNLILAFFNLLPIPPLDGSHALGSLLPPDAAETYRRLGRYSILLLAAVFLFPDLLRVVFVPVEVAFGWSMELARVLG